MTSLARASSHHNEPVANTVSANDCLSDHHRSFIISKVTNNAAKCDGIFADYHIDLAERHSITGAKSAKDCMTDC